MPTSVVAITALLLMVLARASGGEKDKILFAEKFNGRLDAGWSWVREDAKAWKIDKGVLLLRTSTGGLWQKDNNARNLLLRPLPMAKDGVLGVEVFVENEPTNAFEHAGLVWYCDDDHYVVLLREKVGKNTIVQLVVEKEGRPKVGFAERVYPDKSVWLRMDLSGGKARGKFHKTDKDAWQMLGECDLPVKGEPRVGMITGYAAKDAEHWSRFSSFQILHREK